MLLSDALSLQLLEHAFTLATTNRHLGYSLSSSTERFNTTQLKPVLNGLARPVDRSTTTQPEHVEHDRRACAAHHCNNTTNTHIRYPRKRFRSATCLPTRTSAGLPSELAVRASPALNPPICDSLSHAYPASARHLSISPLRLISLAAAA